MADCFGCGNELRKVDDNEWYCDECNEIFTAHDLEQINKGKFGRTIDEIEAEYGEDI